MTREFRKAVSVGGNKIVAVAAGNEHFVTYNGEEKARRVGELGAMLFDVDEDGLPTQYDILLITGGGTCRIFMGRNGELIYSDDPSMLVDKTDSKIYGTGDR